MKLYIKQKVFTIGERFYVKDENNNDVYYVEGSFFRIPKKFEIYSIDNTLVATIEQMLFRLLSHYKITTYEKTYTIKKDFTFFRSRYQVLENGWNIQGNFTSHNYDITKNNETIMHVQKHWFTWGDSYELTINNEENALLALAVVIVIDASLASANNASSTSSSN